jgi:hypothetical protein
MDAYAVGLSVGLQRGVPLTELLQPALGLSFAPAGHTDDPEIPRVRSVVDYLARRLAVDWLSYAQRAAIGVFTISELVGQGRREWCDLPDREARPIRDRRVSPGGHPPVTEKTWSSRDALPPRDRQRSSLPAAHSRFIAGWMTGAPGREASAPYPDAMFRHQGSSPTPAAPTGDGQASLGAGDLLDMRCEAIRHPLHVSLQVRAHEPAHSPSGGVRAVPVDGRAPAGGLVDLDVEPASPFLDAMYTLPDETAVLSVPGFEFERSDLPGNVRLAGILPAPAGGDWEPPAWWGELDGSRPVVVVSQGTLVNDDLSNGGSGGTHQALAAGVPVVVAGETEDKPANAARVAYHRLGINLETASPTAQAVAGAVASLLQDTEVRENALRLAKVYAQHDALDTIERLLLG